MIIPLPDNYIGKADQARLEHFAAHLVANGWATRWYWNRQRGVDMALQLYRGRTGERPVFYFNRNRTSRVFCAKDGAGKTIAEGALPYVMMVVDRLARNQDGEFRA